MVHPKMEFMQAAIEAALKAKEYGDYAIGAVVVNGNKIISKTGGRVKIDHDPTHHAEIVAIREAARILRTRHLKDCVLYTTHEPCPMCASAAIWAMMSGIVSGTKIKDMAEYRKKNGNRNYLWRTIDIPAFKVLKAVGEGLPKPFLIEEFMREECKKLFHC